MAFSQACPLPPLNLSDDQVIWRFMSLTKLLDFLISKNLYFTQIKVLRANDPYEFEAWEFEKQVGEAIDKDDDLALRFFNSGVESDPDMRARIIKSNRETFGMSGLRIRRDVWARSMYVSCWHVSDDEPAGLWKQYSDEYEGVSIKSTVGRLRESLLDAPQELHIGLIEYDNPKTYSRYDVNLFFPAFRKRINFSHERELRIVFFDKDQDFNDAEKVYPLGVKIPCDLSKLIEKVIVGPKCDGWVLSTIGQTIRALMPGANVMRSKLLDGPEY